VRNELGLFLEKLRGKMSLRLAAEKSGLSHTYIRDLELGVNRSTKAPIKPTPETLKRLSEAYNFQYEELMKKAGYIDEDLEGYVVLQDMREALKHHPDKEKLLSEWKEWTELIELDEFLKEIDIADEDILKKYSFKYKGRVLSEEKAKQIISYIRFVAQQEE